MAVAPKLPCEYVLPVDNKVPPDGKLYQFSVPALAVAEIENESPLQIVAGVVDVIVGLAFTVAVTAVRTEVQAPFTDST